MMPNMAALAPIASARVTVDVKRDLVGHVTIRLAPTNQRAERVQSSGESRHASPVRARSFAG